MFRRRGDHEPKGKIKQAIITYILSNPPTVEEPVLRHYLKEEYNVTESKNIKNHLADLLKKNCLRKLPFSGLSNHWLIDDITHFENIFQHFPGIVPELQENEIILVMLIKKYFSSDIFIKLFLDMSDNNDTWKLLKSMLKLSPSFFEHCLKSKEELINEQSVKVWFITTYPGSGVNEYLTKRSKLMQNFEKEKETASEQDIDKLNKKVLNSKKEQLSVELLVPIMLYFDSFLAYVRSDYYEGKIKDDALGDVMHIKKEFEALMEGLEKLNEEFPSIIDNILIS